MTETRYQRIAREQAERQAARELARKPKRRKSRDSWPRDRIRPHEETFETKLDDLGESPDF